MKEFIAKVKSSIYDPAYYRGLLEKPAGYSFRYFFTFIFYVALVSAIVFSFAAVPAAQTLFNWALEKAAEAYPAELEVKLDRGVVSTNVEEPYFIKIPDAQRQDLKRNGTSFDNYLVIDTKTPFSLEEFRNYKTIALLTRDTAVYYKNVQTSETIEIQALNTFPDVTVNNGLVNGWIDKARSIGKFVPAIVVLGMFAGIFIANVFDLLILLLGALVTWLLFWYWSIPGGYKKAYQIGLHALTLPTLVYYLFFFVPAVHSASFFGLMFLISVIMNLWPKAPTSASSLPTAPPA